jgi:hypothetical protein
MNTTTTAPPPVTVPVFPAKEIEAAIRECIDVIGGDQAVLRGSSSQGGGNSGGGLGPQPVIDSLVVVGVLCEVETRVPFELPDSLVRAGGYNSIEEAIGHLMPQIQKRWQKHHQENQ